MQKRSTLNIHYEPLASDVSLPEILNFCDKMPTNYYKLIAKRVLMSYFVPVFASATLITYILKGLQSAIFASLGYFLLIIFIEFFFITQSAKTSMRLKRFASKNGYLYKYFTENGWGGGLLFESGDTQNLQDKLSGAYKNKLFWLGNYSYATGFMKSREVYHTGVMSVKMPKHLPNVLIDTKKQVFGNLWGASYRGNQQFELEGDFNKYFTVYAPANYERDALYFLTPELMAKLIDIGQDYSLETIDDELKFYKKGKKFIFTESEIRNIFKIIDLLGGEFKDNAHQYQDERSAAYNIVGETGKKLKRFAIPKIASILISTLFILLGIVIASISS